MHISAYEACLERIAEELMGLRKWKQYQETLMRSYLNSEQFIAIIDDNAIIQKKDLDKLADREDNHREEEKTTENHFTESNSQQASQNLAQRTCVQHNSSFTKSLANNSITPNILKANIDLKLPECPSLQQQPRSPTSQPRIEPIDWKPNDKCYFCVNGKLLTVNAKGELVAESGPTGSETDHMQRLDCDTDSNESSTLTTNVNNLPFTGGHLAENNRITLNKLLTPHLKTMTSMDSMAVRLAAIQSISGQLLPNFNWMGQQQQTSSQAMQQQQQQQQIQPQQNVSVPPTTSDTLAAAISPTLKESPNSSDATGEQPLDLSSKPSPNSSLIGDLKSVRIRSARSTPVPSTRRIYSEDDLNNALHEILIGRLGTRKAAVQYNVPRSTLRNKIYKLTMEARRNNEQTPSELLQLQQELEKDLSGDEDDISNSSTPQTEELATRIATPVMLRKLQCPGNVDEDLGGNPGEPRHTHISPKPAHLDSSKPQTSDILPEPSTQPPQIPAIDTALLLQTLLLSDKNLRDLFNALLINSTINLKDILLGATTAAANNPATSNENNNLSSSNQAANSPDYRPLLQLLLQQQQQQQQVQQQQHQANSLQTQYGVSRCVPKSETPETSSSLDPNETCDDPSAILKIPSYTPVAGTSSTLGVNNSRGSVSPALLCNNSNSNSNTNRNGDSPGPLLLAAAVNAAKNQLSSNSLSGTPPLLHSGVESQSPQSLRMCDVIASSIHRTMNEQANKDVHAAAVSMLGLGPDSERQSVSDYKKPTISVVKNIGGTDTSRFGSAPNLLAAAAAAGHNSHHHHQPPPHLQHGHHTAAHHLSRQEAAALAAGKGTRPKRGKYRNYDRDSLVEAVKAVQRGEMSVHRAGSYYGVPHSTLEYKVKERHLMRPRKREPKPQPGLDGTSSSSNSTKPNTNIPAGLNSLDKLKPGNNSNANVKLSSALKSNGTPGTSTFSGNTGNGMKLPIFDPALAHLSYAPHLFWQHPQAAAFSQLQMDFNRNSTVAPSSSSPTECSSNILKSHMHRYQDTATAVGNVPGGGVCAGNTTTNSSNAPSPIASPLSGQDINRARELYESSAANGASFLDGIIRKTLDRKSGDITTSPGSGSGVLLDQLLMKKTPMPFTNNRGNEYNNISPSGSGPIKRSGSSLSLTATNIKRERTSPHSGSEDDDTSQSGNDESYETNNNNKKSVKAAIESQRSRLGSRDSASETDTSSLKSETPHNNSGHQLLNSSSNSKLPDLNGGGTIAVKTEIPALETGTSILQEKLSQIKAEQAEAEENL